MLTYQTEYCGASTTQAQTVWINQSIDDQNRPHGCGKPGSSGSDIQGAWRHLESIAPHELIVSAAPRESADNRKGSPLRHLRQRSPHTHDVSFFLGVHSSCGFDKYNRLIDCGHVFCATCLTKRFKEEHLACAQWRSGIQGDTIQGHARDVQNLEDFTVQQLIKDAVLYGIVELPYTCPSCARKVKSDPLETFVVVEACTALQAFDKSCRLRDLYVMFSYRAHSALAT